MNNQPEITPPVVLDERHERTGSVKFADQADESKEVCSIGLVGK